MSGFQEEEEYFMFKDVFDIKDLFSQLQYFSYLQFTGQLDFKIANLQALKWRQNLDIPGISYPPALLSLSWRLYFNQGYLVWGVGGEHPQRRWLRQLRQNHSFRAELSVGQAHSWPQRLNYDALAIRVRQGKLSQKEMTTIVSGHIAEILFDICQQLDQSRRWLKMKTCYEQITQDNVEPKLAAISVEAAFAQTMRDWKTWKRAGLAVYSPNQAPTIRDVESLDLQLAIDTRQNVLVQVDGQQTLRDLAMRLNQSSLLVTRAMAPYVCRGLISWVNVEDQEFFEPPVFSTSQPIASVKRLVKPGEPQPKANLIACIDDSKLDGQIIGNILKQLGYPFLHIQDPMQALISLLEHKPDLIFLDLLMPIANGYEICSQIRRITAFRDTPVIILTSSGGIVDRVRAKVVGSTDFLAKPIELEQVQAVLQKYLCSSSNLKQSIIPEIGFSSPRTLAMPKIKA